MKCPNHRNKVGRKRGLCLTCYNLLNKRVQRGQETWEALEAQGLVLPCRAAGRPRKVLKAV